MTDIVGSTRTIERIGDEAWRELIETHEHAIRQELVVYGGREIDTAGDGFLAAFDSPTQAIRCGFAVVDRSSRLELVIRAGIHTGELDDADGKPRGMGIHIASRISGRAGSGEILVSSTTRELASGAGLVFTDRGEHPLRGVTEPRRLYAVSLPESVDEISATRANDLPANLTAREVDVLRLVAMGLSDAEVAERLVVSVRTVNAHLRSIYRKIGVRSRAAAGRFAQENELL